MINKFKIFFVVFIICCLVITGIIFANKKPSLKELKPINIVYITDDNYVTYLRASIKSLIKNKNKNTKIEIYVIGVDLSEKSSKKLIKESKKNVHVNIVRVSSGSFQDLEGGAKLNPYVSRADNAKFFLTSILKDFDKVLYLDSDTIILKDLYDFYNTDLTNNYVGAVKDWQTRWYQDDSKKYFNNGVMLLNLIKMREDDIETKLINFKKNDKVKRFVTQDAFNNVMYGKVIFLPFIYDTFSPEYDDNINVPPYKNKEDFRKDVAIIHYCGYDNIKPWWGLDFSRKSGLIWYRYAPLEFWIDYFKANLENNG